MIIPLFILFVFIPVVYALGGSIKISGRVERVVPATLEQLHKFVQRREKMAEYNPNMYVRSMDDGE